MYCGSACGDVSPKENYYPNFSREACERLNGIMAHGAQNYCVIKSSKVYGSTMFKQNKEEDHQLSKFVGLAGCK